jgi:hypothetical protein
MGGNMSLAINGSDEEQRHRKELSLYFLPHVVEQIIQWEPTWEEVDAGKPALKALASKGALVSLMVAVSCITYHGPAVFIDVQKEKL